MAEGVPVLSARMRENLFIGDNGTDSLETESQGSRDEIIERDPGCVEDRFRVDRKKLEQMLQLVPSNDDSDETAEDFFQRIMEETNTQITWPSKLKIGAKSKKDPHIKVIGYPENVRSAKSKILPVLDTKSNRVTLKMDVSHTEHSHVIGKGGNNIKRVMTETGCHIHFPDSNRGSNLQEKSNQVSIAGQPDGVEIARAQIR
ncbi:protein bicaudal c homolog 1, partial [Plakobranchus ocellatus]